MDLFTDAGVAAWQQHLNQSLRFAQAAADWAGRIVLQEAGSGRQTWIVIDRGRCAEARSAASDDVERADFVLAASAVTWSALASGQVTPMQAAVAGRLSLVKGSVMALLPHARAAAELLAAATHSLP
jgi:putative sterol carrier protein